MPNQRDHVWKTKINTIPNGPKRIVKKIINVPKGSQRKKIRIKIFSVKKKKKLNLTFNAVKYFGTKKESRNVLNKFCMWKSELSIPY